MVKLKAHAQGGAGAGVSRASIAKMQQKFKGNPKAMMQAQLQSVLGADAINSMGGMDAVLEMAQQQSGMMNPELAQQMGGMPGGGVNRRGRSGRR